MAQTTLQTHDAMLDRAIDLSRIRWLTVIIAFIVVTAIGLRLAQLDAFPLSQAEARRAYQAYSFYRGSTSGPAQSLPETAPAFTLLQSVSFFLFGATDATARFVSAFLGIGIVLLGLRLGQLLSGPAAAGIAALAAISPTLLYASRIADPQVAVAFFSLLALYALVRMGTASDSLSGRYWWAAVAGAAFAAGFASSPAALTVYLCLAIAGIVELATNANPDSIMRRVLAAYREQPRVTLAFVGGLLVTVLVLFSRLFTDLSALSGIGGTFADWGRLLSTATSTTPTQFFLLTLLLYEPLAILFAIIGANRGVAIGSGAVSWPFFATWFVAALLIFSFSSGRAPEHTVLIVLPLVLLGGAALGETIASIDWLGPARGRTWALLGAYFGLALALIGFAVLIDRTGDAPDQGRVMFQALTVLLIAVAPFAVVTYTLVKHEALQGTSRRAATIALAVITLFLGAYAVRSSVMLSFYNAVEGFEPLAQRTTTPAVPRLVERVPKLSRDVTVTQGSTRDPTGGHGLTIAIDRRAQWPIRWYFRDFPDAEVVAPGQAPQRNAQIIIAPDDAGMAEAGYTPSQYPVTNRVPVAYTAPDIGDVVKSIFVVTYWDSGLRYLIEHRPQVVAPPETIAVGFNAELANRLFPNTGPFGLFDRAGPGSGRGQFNGPRDIAVSPDGSTVYVVDMGNARVERFDALGDFIGAWGGEASDVTFERTSSGLGPTGITVGQDGLIYVCDTWNHRVVILDSTGRLIREFGSFQDTQDAPDPSVSPGLFFGPRDVAVTSDEIYVVDTGNERVQVFAFDGTFRRAFGGYGTEIGKLIEPVGIAIGPDGRVYVADSGNARIAVFATDGTPLDAWPVEAWVGHAFYEPYLAFDAAGNLYATSSATGSVEVFDRNGQYRESLTEINNERLQEPVGITAAPDGAMLITDKGRHAVFRYVPPPPEEETPNVAPASPEASPQSSPAPGA